MKPLQAFILILFAATQLHAKIWRVNNTGISADFTTLQAAHDGAAAGDTLLVEGSPNSYGNLIYTKKLIVIGTGYFLSENNPTQANLISAKAGNIYFDPGSNGSMLMGLEVQFIYVAASDIAIRRNLVSSTYLYLGINSQNQQVAGIRNIIIAQNYVMGAITSNNDINSLLISNNYLYAINLSIGTTAVIDQNVIAGYLRCYNSTLQNNIITFANDPDFSINNSTANNNLMAGSKLGTANGNKSNVNMTTVFLGPTNNSTDEQWRLKPGSPAIGAGTAGEDAGMFGGANPYVLSGLPPLPTIYSLIVPASVGKSMRVNIRVKSNQ